MKKLIVGNWKMNLSPQEARKLCEDLANAPADYADILVCPSYVHIQQAAWFLQKSPIMVGAQDCAVTEQGAYTGDVAASMLKDLGCGYVIVGHSERRHGHAEGSKLVKQKAAMAHQAGLIAIICIGETETQREAGQETQVVEKQLAELLPPGANAQNTVIAYEPVWAIGTGKTAMPADVKAMHGFIRGKLQEKLADSQNFRILYGGSVKPENAAELLATENVDGALVGGASLKADQFLEIIKAAKA